MGSGAENGRMRVFQDISSGRSELRPQVSGENSGDHINIIPAS